MKHPRALCYLAMGLLLLALALIWSQEPTWATGSATGLQQSIPTRTPAPPTPIGVTLNVTLERPNAPPPDPSWAVPVHLAFYPPGDEVTVMYEFNVVLDQSGQWSGQLLLSPWTYDVRLKNMHTLRNVRRNVYVSDPAVLDMGKLLEGDADDDNRVRSSDFTILRAAYFTDEGDPGFDPRADFDEDNRIRSSDFALLRGNYFKSGDIEVSDVAGASAPASPRGSVAVALEPASTEVLVGDTFTLTLMAHAGTQPFVALDGEIEFPAGVLQVVSADGQPATEIEPLADLPTVLVNRVDNTRGRIIYGAGVPLTGAPVSGDVAVARIRFRALAGSPGAPVRLLDVTVADPSGKWVQGPLSGALVTIKIPFSRFIYLPLVLHRF